MNASSMPPPHGGGHHPLRPAELTGDYLVLLADQQVDSGVQALRANAGLSVEAASPEDVQSYPGHTGEGGVVFPDLGVAVVKAEPDSAQAVGVAAADPSSAIVALEPERVVYAIDSLSQEYLRGYSAAAAHLAEAAGSAAVAGGAAIAAGPSEAELTWGIQATGAAGSPFTGDGVSVAVLDTGFDSGHPDFAGRNVTMESFVAGEPPQDGHGHGTHCIGTSCGGLNPGQAPIYGIAHQANIFAGKVLSNAGRGADRGILAGIAWAMRSGARVISMSLGSPTQPGQAYSRVFESAAQRAMRAGSLIVAAAGNESDRPGLVAPVGHPANCPSIMAVAAVDSAMAIAPFSCGGTSAVGGQVDIAGPGVAVRSSWPRPRLYNTISGTSMATPHVAGIAALWAESRSDLDARGLWSMLVQRARRLPLSSADVGAGLVQAP